MACPGRLSVFSCLVLSACATKPDRPTCEVHGLALLDDEVPVLYGYVVPRACDVDPGTPHVNDHVWGGCFVHGHGPSGFGPSTARVRYCPACRRAIARRPIQMSGPTVHWVPE